MSLSQSLSLSLSLYQLHLLLLRPSLILYQLLCHPLHLPLLAGFLPVLLLDGVRARQVSSSLKSEARGLLGESGMQTSMRSSLQVVLLPERHQLHTRPSVQMSPM